MRFTTLAPFACLPRTLLRRLGQMPRACERVLSHIATWLTAPDQWRRLRIALMAQELGYAYDTVRRAIYTLRKAGLIETEATAREDGGNGALRYRICYSAAARSPEGPGAGVAAPVQGETSLPRRSSRGTPIALLREVIAGLVGRHTDAELAVVRARRSDKGYLQSVRAELKRTGQWPAGCRLRTLGLVLREAV